jgi:type IV pilus assembly protein PilE
MNYKKCERQLRESKQTKGLTLTKPMIAVAIIGVIGAFAYPSYRDSVRKSNRAEGRALLTDAAGRQERFFSNFDTYTSVIVSPDACAGAACGLGYSSDTSGNGSYKLSIPAADAAAYTLHATAVGKQASDTSCATLSVDSKGQKVAPSSDCW